MLADTIEDVFAAAFARPAHGSVLRSALRRCERQAARAGLDPPEPDPGSCGTNDPRSNWAPWTMRAAAAQELELAPAVEDERDLVHLRAEVDAIRAGVVAVDLRALRARRRGRRAGRRSLPATRSELAPRAAAWSSAR